MNQLPWQELKEEFPSFTEEQLYFFYQIEKGWERKLGRLLKKHPEKHEEYWNRLVDEVRVILNMNFPGYFLITQDFLQWGDTQGIRRGPGRGCYIGDTPVLLSDFTSKPLREIISGDSVISHKGNVCKVRSVQKYPIEEQEQLLSYTTAYMPWHENVCTLTHPVFTWRNGELQETLAQDLNVGDLVALPLPRTKQEKTVFDLVDFCQNESGKKQSKIRYDRQYIWIETVGPRQVRERVSTRQVALAVQADVQYTRKVLKRYFAGQVSKAKGKAELIVQAANRLGYTPPDYVKLPRFVELDQDLAILLGYYTAEGWAYRNALGFGFHEKEQKFRDKIGSILKEKFGLYSYQVPSKKHKAISIECSCLPLANLFSTLCGSLAGNKKVPQVIMEAPLSIVRSYLWALVDGDGSTTSKNCMLYSTTSFDLARQAGILFARFGIYGSHLKDKPSSPNWNPEYRLKFTCSELEAFFEDYQEGDFCYNDVAKKNSSSQREWRIEDGYLLLPIRSLERQVAEMPFVYDLQVEEDHSYIVNNHATHNSAGGCLIAFLLDITKIDPLKYGLLFSRFLNADRVSMPDIDNDIETDRRDEVKQYLKRKYGDDRVASIGTFGTMKVRACIKDIIRSLNLGGNKTEAFKIADQVNSMMPNEADITFQEACNRSPEFKALVWYPTKEELENGWAARIKQGETPSKFWQVGYHLRKMEGMIRQTGTHAAGVIVSPAPLCEILPMAIDKNNVTVTANPGKMVEDAGFLKIDLLGLNTLSIIQRCVENIKKTRDIDLKAIPLNGAPLVVDESDRDFAERIKQYSEPIQQASKAFRLCRQGKTEGVFQCESAVAKSLLQDLQVNSIEDLSAVLALNRPGPLKAGLVKEYGGRKFGTIKWDLPHPATKKVLEPTYGILCIAEGEKIYDPISGRNFCIETIPKNHLVQSYDSKTHKSGTNVSIDTINNGAKQVTRFTLATGYTIACTEDHKVETCLGEMSISEAFEKEIPIALPKKLLVQDGCIADKLLRTKLRILGLLLAEGSLTNSTAIHFTTSEVELEEDFRQNLKKAYPRCKTEEYPGRTEGTKVLSISKNEEAYDVSMRLNHIPNDLLIDLREWGLKQRNAAHLTTKAGCDSQSKFIPPFVFTLDEVSKKILLGGLWDGDGACHPEKALFFYTTVSERLAEDVLLLMRQVGYLPIFKKRKDGAYRISLSPEDCSDLSSYCCLDRKRIVYEGKGERITALTRSLVMERIAASGHSLSRVAKLSGVSLSTLTAKASKKRKTILNTAVRPIAVALEDPVLLNLLQDTYWVPIEKKEELGERTVYDLSMRDSKRPWFIGGQGGIVLHNCYQEQCMQLAVDCAGFTMAEADTLRKAIGKKVFELMVKFEEKFVQGCYKKFEGFDKKVEYETLEELQDGSVKKVTKSGTVAQQLWNSVVFFAGYGFNKCFLHTQRLKMTNGKEYKIGDLAGEDCKDLQMFSIASDGRVVENQIEEVFCVGEEEVWEFELENGERVHCTPEHKFLCTDNVYRTIRQIFEEGYELDEKNVD